ncbi:LacI family transcriptional regulator [Lacrimispora amygdalina]|uniref:LacI family transcriptional regulator n=1 Tax=Lacrimispora amygdalina TaxID=253257 RepID=A0A3E2NH20_9FIRM|nr:LacI family DNA-binding transcriptional regulator [Clostridium indicum]RFZ80233.1 LacI family transcriptional regulator [Clostridium indicum]
MATIKELAKCCGVSVATVSNILNNKPGASEKTRKLVLEMAEQLNYTPNIVAKNLKMQKTRSIGVIAEDMTIFSIPDIIDGITDYCQKQEYQILLTNLRLFKKYNDTYYNKDDYYELVRQEIKKLMEKQVEGIIYVAAHERVIRCIPDTLPIPAVMAYGYSRSRKIPSVVVDDVSGAARIVKYLLDNGHRRVGVITGKPDSLHAQARLVGYQQVLFENKILYDPGLVTEGDWTRESGYRCAGELLDKGVSAIFAMNDLMAGGVYDRVEELKQTIGYDISVAGYDDRELSGYYHPPLTTVSLPLHDIGYKASEWIIELLNGGELENDGENVCAVDCMLLIRKSVKDLT